MGESEEKKIETQTKRGKREGTKGLGRPSQNEALSEADRNPPGHGPSGSYSLEREFLRPPE